MSKPYSQPGEKCTDTNQARQRKLIKSIGGSMNKATEAIKYMIAVWDEVQGNWRETPDHVQRKFLEAEAELKEENQ